MRKDYKRLRKPFGNFVLFVLDRHLPRNFDRSIFKQWKESLSALRGRGEAEVDGFEIEVQKGGVKKDDGEVVLVQEVVIRIAKSSKTAQGVNEVIAHTGKSACALVV